MAVVKRCHQYPNFEHLFFNVHLNIANFNQRASTNAVSRLGDLIITTKNTWHSLNGSSELEKALQIFLSETMEEFNLGVRYRFYNTYRGKSASDIIIEPVNLIAFLVLYISDIKGHLSNVT